MGSLGDFLHALFVLCTNLSYILPLAEARRRGSTFYTVLFLALGLLSVVLHCEETALCSDLPPAVHGPLFNVDQGLSYFLLGVMSMVTLEIKEETVGRCVFAAWALFITARDVTATKFNVLGTAALALLIFAYDTNQHRRRFSRAWALRLVLIAGLAAVGALLFKLLKTLWVWHGLWHLYYATTCWLLLLAQRTKRLLQAAAATGATSSGRRLSASAGGSSSSGSSLGASANARRRGVQSPSAKGRTLAAAEGAAAPATTAGAGAVASGDVADV